MKTIFKNSENSTTPKPHILILKLMLYQILVFIIHGKI